MIYFEAIQRIELSMKPRDRTAAHFHRAFGAQQHRPGSLQHRRHARYVAHGKVDEHERCVVELV